MMLTSSASQYLHPDYLQPLPTTLDAKKSPLALLAQTCSSIGKDSTPSKPIIPPLEKAKDGSGPAKSDSPASVKSGATDDRRSQPSAEKGSDSPGADKTSFRTPAPKDIPPLVPIPSGRDKSSPRGSPETSSSKTTEGTNSSSIAGLSSSSSGPSSSKFSIHSSMMIDSQSESASSTGLPKATTSVPSTSHTTLTGSLKPESLTTPATGSLPPTIGPYPGCGLPFLPHHLSLDAAASSAYHASLAAHGLSSQKAGSLSGAPFPGTSPYVAYAHVKTASGATTLVPICRDPYCTNCQLTLQSAQLSRCGAGCTQCNHEKTLGSSSLGTAGLPLLPPTGGLPGMSSTPGSSSYPPGYPHSLGLLTGHHGLPYVCNWMSGSDYCGKRFNTSEELLQHLRTHTSSTDSAALASALPSYSHALATPGALGCHSHYSAPGSLSPNSLRSTYPRSLSPSSYLAANRYHPYKSPLSSLPTAPTLPSLPAGLSPYYSPYALYGQRLGAAVAP